MSPDRESSFRGASRSVRASSGGDGGPSVIAMVLAVAAIVALVILVFFGIGYGLGRLFL